MYWQEQRFDVNNLNLMFRIGVRTDIVA